MARLRTMTIGVLNIKIQDEAKHKPVFYVDLFNDILKRSYVSKIRGTDRGTIGWMKQLDDSLEL